MRRRTEFDIVVFGATGYTGRLVAAHFARRDVGLRLALAGRSLDKLARCAIRSASPRCR
jgi:short subunit dehydrogenase-like uncharacterized protein